MDGITASEVRKGLGRNLAAEVARIYKSTRPRPKWILIENGEYFRLHRIQDSTAVRTNKGSASFHTVIEHAFTFCFIAGETPGAGNIRLYTDIGSIPEFYRRYMQPDTVMVSKTHSAYKFGCTR